jgi:hypothetical protein
MRELPAEDLRAQRYPQPVQPFQPDPAQDGKLKLIGRVGDGVRVARIQERQRGHVDNFVC